MKRYLILQDGTKFTGEAFGAQAAATGEIVFTTAVVGYIEKLTDPVNSGMIVTETFPLIGNYGMIEEDTLGAPTVAGYVVREICENPSNFRSGGKLNDYLVKHGIPGICGIDTRELTRHIRDNGSMNAVITDDPEVDMQALAAYADDAALERTLGEAVTYAAENKRFTVAALGTCYKSSVAEELAKRGCEVTVYPYGTPAQQLTAADGVLLLPGAGDPNKVGAVEDIKQMAGNKPIMAIGLGHELLALALGAQVKKLKYGHRGASQPVKDTLGTRTFITSQNHGYYVVSESVVKGKVRYINVNDNTCEGIDYEELNAFSMAFTPASCKGPNDTSFAFEKFISMMEV